jgi:protein associated with RNAse G/E
LNQQITINSLKYDGSVRRSWSCKFVDKVGDLLVFIGEFETEVNHPDLGHIKRGTISYEYYWLDRWYNVFRFHEPDGKIRNYYCNINMPPKFEDGILEYIDLDIDVVVWHDFSLEKLDVEEFEEHAEKFGYPEEVLVNAQLGLEELMALIEAREFPFDYDQAIAPAAPRTAPHA